MNKETAKPEMSKEDAVKILGFIVSQYRATPQEHIELQKALEVVSK